MKRFLIFLSFLTFWVAPPLNSVDDWFPGVAIAYAEGEVEETPLNAFGEARSITDWIDGAVMNRIKECDSTDNINQALEDAIRTVCGESSISPSLSFPSGCYPIWAPGIDASTIAEGGIGCNGLQLIGNVAGYRISEGPQFVAMDDRIGTLSNISGASMQDALFKFRGNNSVAIMGFIWNGNNTVGNLLAPELNQYLNIIFNTFLGVKGNPYSYAASNAGTEVITLDSGQSNYAVGDRIELVPADNGGAVPGGTTAYTGYYIRTKVGSNITLSATLGGATLNLTTSVSTFMVYKGTWTFTNTNVSVATDTITITDHTLQNGDRVEGTFSDTSLQVGGYNIYSVPFYVVNRTPDTFQFSLTPGGAVVNINYAGVPGELQRISKSYADIYGGALLYPIIEYNRFVDDVRAIKLAVFNVPNHGGAYYGANEGRTRENLFQAPILITGIGEISSNTHENQPTFPAGAMVETADYLPMHTIVSKGYFESGLPGPVPYIAISGIGPSITFLYADYNRIYGPSSDYVNSKCFRINSIPSGGSFNNNLCRATGYCFASTTIGSRDAGTSYVYGSSFTGNSCPELSVEGLPVPTSVNMDPVADPPAVVYINHPVRGRVQQTGGNLSFALGVSTGNTSVDLARSSIISMLGGWDVQTLTNADWIGAMHWWFGTDVVADRLRVSSGIQTTTGTDLFVQIDETVGMITDENGTEVLMHRNGNAVGYINNGVPLTSQVGDQSGNFFISTVTGKGLYYACIYVAVTTAGLGGTQDVVVTYSDTIGSTSQTVIDDMSLGPSQTRAGDCVLIELDGLTNVGWAVTQAAVSGSPLYSIRGTVLKYAGN